MILTICSIVCRFAKSSKGYSIRNGLSRVTSLLMDNTSSLDQKTIRCKHDLISTCCYPPSFPLSFFSNHTYFFMIIYMCGLVICGNMNREYWNNCFILIKSAISFSPSTAYVGTPTRSSPPWWVTATDKLPAMEYAATRNHPLTIITITITTT